MAELWSDGVASWSRPISCWFGMPSFWLFTFGMIFGHQQPMFVLSSKCSFPMGSKNQWHIPREAIHCKPIPVEPMADPNAPDAIVAADEESAYQWPARHQLASCWEENGIVRQNLRDTGRMLLWPNRDLTGIATLAALSSNRVIVADALTIWATHSFSEAKSPPVEWLKDEASFGERWFILYIYVILNPN